MTVRSILWNGRTQAAPRIASCASGRTISEQTREVMLRTIARARACVEALASGSMQDLSAVAEREELSERYLRAQLALAYLSPKVVEAIANGAISVDVTITRLWSALPISWAEQERELLRGTVAQ
jgi:site-specific DNA recombinase